MIIMIIMIIITIIIIIIIMYVCIFIGYDFHHKRLHTEFKC